jgi:hypothetical protein
MPRKLRVAAKAAPRPRPAAINHARDDAMAAIARQRGSDGANNALLDKAELLLTRHWAKSGWAARGKLVDGAEWLLRAAAGAHLKGHNHLPSR